ncbi:DUF4865 family protein [Nocardia aurea]|uniref:DUF4865 family protein n=1 Tax=Nocardia aurea TaxID=2144174 RepID=UPI0033B9ED0F
MYAKQYGFTLPASYDMTTIRELVARASSATDDWKGLGLKAYMIRERGINDSPVNEYALFYLWNDIAEMARFLVGGNGFQHVIRSLGRPEVQHWMGLASMAGPARDTAPTAATRHLTPLTADADPDGTGLMARIEREIAELTTLATHPEVHTAALALDPKNWQLLRFTLWSTTVPASDDHPDRYEVLHLSTPGLHAMPAGQLW